MFGGWQRRAYEVPDGRLVQAEREIYRTFGEQVSVDKKAKSLIKALAITSLGSRSAAQRSLNMICCVWRGVSIFYPLCFVALYI